MSASSNSFFFFFLKCPFLCLFSGTPAFFFKTGFSSSHLCGPVLSQFVWVHPSVCALVAEAHLLHQLISLCRTSAKRERAREDMRYVTPSLHEELLSEKWACFTSRICIWWVVSSPSLSDEEEEWRFSRLPSTRHFNKISQIQKWFFMLVYMCINVFQTNTVSTGFLKSNLKG